ncbi:DUF6612 family protein [Thalassobacillus sp. CUG 92003]|uniref:DUF6612 family protein n=1 Tax=Thalassobacillus sp. CUG 92003 TaxID=2736641 RepID=UPI0015E6C14C|nr:DUF6612 family protein [Thalassobacillus sp. CUG 92003]
MKRRVWGIACVLMAVFVLTACSASEQAKLQDIYSQANEASKELDSLAVDMTMEQQMDLTGITGADGKENLPGMNGMNMESEIQAEMITDPLALHQTMTMMGQEVEMYYKEDEMYISQPGTNGWMKAPKEMMKQINQMTNVQQTPAEQLDLLKDYVDDFTMEEDDDHYTLSFSSKGDNVKQLIEETMKQALPEDQWDDQMMDAVTVEQLSYTFKIAKDTHYPESFDMAMEFTVDENGETSTISQKVNGDYSKFNEIGDIEIPQEVSENATEMPNLQQ